MLASYVWVHILRLDAYMWWWLIVCPMLSFSLSPEGESASLHRPLCAVLRASGAAAWCPAHSCFQWFQAGYCQCSKAGKTEASPSGSCPRSQNSRHMVQGCRSLPREKVGAGRCLSVPWHCAGGTTNFPASFSEAACGAADSSLVLSCSRRELVRGWLLKYLHYRNEGLGLPTRHHRWCHYLPPFLNLRILGFLIHIGIKDLFFASISLISFDLIFPQPECSFAL